MANFSTITNSKDYVNYVFNIGTRGVIETTTEIVGMSHTIQNLLGNLAFKTSEYLTSTETIAMSFGIAATAAFTHATQSAIEFEKATASVEAISGRGMSGSTIGAKAMAMSNEFGLAVSNMTEGLEALARAGITAQGSIDALLRAGVQMSKFEGTDLEESINSVLSTVNLLNPTANPDSEEYAQIVADLNQKIISTSESAPINAQNIMHTLQHVGGYASSTGIDQDDLFGVIAQLGAKGTKGELAGTALRAFISAGQKDTAQRALARIGLDVTDLWTEDGSAMLPLSEMKRVLDEAITASGFSPQERLEFYSDFAGYKQANQIMKIDSDEVEEYNKKIQNAMSLTDKMNIILGTVAGNWSQIWNTVSNYMTRVGSTLLPIINAILIPIKYIVKAIDAIPFSNYIGALALGSLSIKGLSAAFNALIPTIVSFISKFIDLERKGFSLKGYFEGIKESLAESLDIIKHMGDKEYMRNIMEKRDTESTDKELSRRFEREAIDAYYRQMYGSYMDEFGNRIWRWDTMSKSEKAYVANAHTPDYDVIKQLIESRKYLYEQRFKAITQHNQAQGHFEYDDESGWADINNLFMGKGQSYEETITNLMKEIADNIAELIKKMSVNNSENEGVKFNESNRERNRRKSDNQEVLFNESNRERNRRKGDNQEVIFNESNRERNRRKSKSREDIQAMLREEKRRRDGYQDVYGKRGTVYGSVFNDFNEVNASIEDKIPKLTMPKPIALTKEVGEFFKINPYNPEKQYSHTIESTYRDMMDKMTIREAGDYRAKYKGKPYSSDSDVHAVQKHLRDSAKAMMEGYGYTMGGSVSNKIGILFNPGASIARYFDIMSSNRSASTRPKPTNVFGSIVGTMAHEMTHSVLGHGWSSRYVEHEKLPPRDFDRTGFFDEEHRLAVNPHHTSRLGDGNYSSKDILKEFEANYVGYNISRMLGLAPSTLAVERLLGRRNEKWRSLIEREQKGADIMLSFTDAMIDTLDDDILNFISLTDDITKTYQGKTLTERLQEPNVPNILQSDYRSWSDHDRAKFDDLILQDSEEFNELKEAILLGESLRQELQNDNAILVDTFLDNIQDEQYDTDVLISSIIKGGDKARKSAPLKRKAKALHGVDLINVLNSAGETDTKALYKDMLTKQMFERKEGYSEAIMAMAFNPILDDNEMEQLNDGYKRELNKYKVEELNSLKATYAGEEWRGHEMKESDDISIWKDYLVNKHSAKLEEANARATEKAQAWLGEELRTRGGIKDENYIGMKMEDIAFRDVGWNIINGISMRKHKDGLFDSYTSPTAKQQSWKLGGYTIDQRMLEMIQKKLSSVDMYDDDMKQALATMTPDEWYGYYMGLKDYEKASMRIAFDQALQDLDLSLFDIDKISNDEYDFINPQDYALMVEHLNIPQRMMPKSMVDRFFIDAYNQLASNVESIRADSSYVDDEDRMFALRDAMNPLNDAITQYMRANLSNLNIVEKDRLQDLKNALTMITNADDINEAFERTNQKILDDIGSRVVKGGAFDYSFREVNVMRAYDNAVFGANWLDRRMNTDGYNKEMAKNDVAMIIQRNNATIKTVKDAGQVKNRIKDLRTFALTKDQQALQDSRNKMLDTLEIFSTGNGFIAELFGFNDKDDMNRLAQDAQQSINDMYDRINNYNGPESNFETFVNDEIGAFVNQYSALITFQNNEHRDAINALKRLSEILKESQEMLKDDATTLQDYKKSLVNAQNELYGDAINYNPKWKDTKVVNFRFIKQWLEDETITDEEREERLNQVAEFMAYIRDNPLARTIDFEKWSDDKAWKREAWFEHLKKEGIVPEEAVFGKGDYGKGQSGYQFYHNVRNALMKSRGLNPSDITNPQVKALDKLLQDKSESFFDDGYVDVNDIQYRNVANNVKNAVRQLEAMGLNGQEFVDDLIEEAKRRAKSRGQTVGGTSTGSGSTGGTSAGGASIGGGSTGGTSTSATGGASAGTWAGGYAGNPQPIKEAQRQIENLQAVQNDLMKMATTAQEQAMYEPNKHYKNAWINNEANRIAKRAKEAGHPLTFDEAKAKAEKKWHKKSPKYGAGERFVTGYFDGKDYMHGVSGNFIADIMQQLGKQQNVPDKFMSVGHWADSAKKVSNMMETFGLWGQEAPQTMFRQMVTEVGLEGKLDENGQFSEFIDKTLEEAEDIRDWTTLWTIAPEVKERELAKLEGIFMGEKAEAMINAFGSAERATRMSDEERAKYYQNTWVDDVFEWQNRAKEKITTTIDDAFGAYNEKFNTAEGVEKFQEYMFKTDEVLGKASARVSVLKDGMSQLAGIFPVLTPLVWGLTVAETALNGARSFLAMVTIFLTDAEVNEAKAKIMSKFANVKQAIAGTLGNAMSKIVGFVTGLSGTTVALIGGVVLAIAGVIFALKKSAEAHDKYVEELTNKQVQYDKASQSAYITYEANKKRIGRGAKDAEQQSYRETMYRLSETKLRSANLKRQINAIELAEAKSDMLWGEYGARGELQAGSWTKAFMQGGFIGLIAKYFAGEFQSQYEEHLGYTGNIRKIKEATMQSDFFHTTDAMRVVSAYYDAHELAFRNMEQYKTELGELYDIESRYVKKTGDVDSARQNQRFQKALLETSEKTGLTQEQILDYLNWIQLEKNIDTATQAMQATADEIVANAEMQAVAVEYGQSMEDVLGLNGQEAQQKAMVQAQADMIRMEAEDKLWWKMVWAEASAIFWQIVSPISIISNFLQYIYLAVAYIGAVVGHGWWSDEAKNAGNALDRKGKDLQSSFGDMFGVGRAGRKVGIYRDALGNLHSTNLAEVGESAISPYDRNNFGNGSDSSTGFVGMGSSSSASKTNKNIGNATQMTSKRNTDEIFANRLREEQRTGIFDIFDLLKHWRTKSESNWVGNFASGILSFTPFGPILDFASGISSIFSSDEDRQKAESALSATKNAVDKASAGDKGTVIIRNININTDDDPEKIKTALMNMIIELQEQIQPRTVSRTVGEQSNSQTNTGADNIQPDTNPNPN